MDWEPLGRAGLAIGLAVLLGYVFHHVVWRLLRRIARSTSTLLDDSLVRHCRRPTVFVFPVLALQATLPLLPEALGEEHVAFLAGLLPPVLVFSLAWTLIQLTSVAEDFVTSRYDIDVADNLRARAIQTQFGIIRKIVVVVIGVFAIGTTLMSFESFRELGTGILASAGLAGLVVGFAAQKTLANLLAGIQIALTQPIRLDDVLIVEGEWGRVEEITLTYVVVRIWDRRRLVLPIGYFLEKPFQNWTRTSADILGSVTLHLDYTAPVDAIRARLEEIARQSDHWDGEVCGVQVTDSGPQGIDLRALVSAADASKSWDLRCEVREKLIAFLQEHHPECLPRVRTEVVRVPDPLPRGG